MFFTYILRTVALLGAIQAVIVWLGRLIRLLSQTVIAMQTAGFPRLRKAYSRRTNVS